MVIMTIVSYLSDEQYQSIKGLGQQPHGSVAPFSSFLSLTRFLHIEAPVHEEMSLS